MKFTHVIDDFIEAMRDDGRMNSPLSERAYRDVLMWHAEDVDFRDPRYTGREDVQRTLRRWANANTKSKRRSYLISFYDWMVWEGLRPHNPARQTRPPKRRPVNLYRLTFDESVRLLMWAETVRERRAIYLMLCAGLRNREVRQLQGRHFARPGWIWVSADIAKGGRERYVPVLPDLEPIVAEILDHVQADEFILPALRMGNPGVNTRQVELPMRACSQQALGDIVLTVSKRAGISARVTPHMLRHAFADHVVRGTRDIRMGQHLLGHADVSTTQGYLGKPLLDDLAAAVRGITFGLGTEHAFYPSAIGPANPLTPRAGFEPATSAIRALERFSAELCAATCAEMREVLVRG